MKQTVTFKCIEITQPIGTFYVGCINFDDLIAISVADIRTIDEERRDIETYLGIQRPLSPGRVKELEDYVNLIDASFPTSIILAIAGKDASYDPKSSTMSITKAENVAKILDGQHRIAGLKQFRGKTRFELNLTIFVDIDIDDQAMTFATINLKQTKVNKSLAYDLYDYAKTRSPQKTCHDIAKLLNSKKNSPFEGRIKILGQAIDKERETITQATFVESLMRYISRHPMKDRDDLKRHKKLEDLGDAENSRYFLRELFRKEKDADIALLIWNYFGAVQQRWPTAWMEASEGNILNRSTGFIALMRFFKNAFLAFEQQKRQFNKENCLKLFHSVKLTDKHFTRENYLPGSSGQKKLYEVILRQSSIQ